jgi:YidC/Oxa1 family membrane protein insertase
MEKRVFIAILLSFVVLAGYQAMFPPPEPQKTTASQPPAPGGSAAPSPAPTTPAPAATAPAAERAPVEAPAGPPAAAPVTGDPPEREIAFENGSVRAVFSNRGGVIKSWRLKKYLNAAKEPLELVPHDVPPGLPKPFTLSVEDPAITAAVNGTRSNFVGHTLNLSTAGSGIIPLLTVKVSHSSARNEASWSRQKSLKADRKTCRVVSLCWPSMTIRRSTWVIGTCF